MRNIAFSAFLLICLSLMVSCKKEEVESCSKRTHDYFWEEERVEIVGNRVNYFYTGSDTAIFSYTGYDTLIFEVTDSTGIFDTVQFVGKGKRMGQKLMGSFRISNDCYAQRYQNRMDIAFVPENPAYDTLNFSLIAHIITADVVYDYGEVEMTGSSRDINREDFYGYKDLIQERNKIFYKVACYSRSSPLGRVDYYMNEHYALFLFVINGSTRFLKIN